MLSLPELLELPSRIFSFVSFSSLIFIALALVYLVVVVGYPRPISTHHTYDPYAQCTLAIERIFKAIDTINAVKEDRIARAFGGEVEQLQRAFEIIHNDHEPRSQIVMRCVDAVLKPNGGQSSLASQRMINAVYAIGKKRISISQLVSSSDSEAVHRTACALADIRLVAMQVLPDVRSVAYEKSRVLTRQQIINRHVSPQFENFRKRVKAAFEVTKTGVESESAKEVLKYLRDLANWMLSTEH